jgi:predicted RNA-binding Zn ribbon-like protein
MTVSSAPLPLSRAGSLALVGGNPALDFANTESGRGTEGHQNHLREPGNVAAWAEHAGALLGEDVRRLRAELSAEPELGATLLSRALELRSMIQEVGSAIAEGRAPPEADLSRLSNLHVSYLGRAVLVANGGTCRWRWRVEESPVAATLGPIALAAVKLFTEGDFQRIKQCGGHACGWLFYDSTKNNSRRWCEMEVCGNRAKQKRLAARRRGV